MAEAASSAPSSPAGIRARTDDDEVVIHHVEALHAETVGNEGLLELTGMDEDDIRVAPTPGLKRLPGALCDDTDLDPGLFLEKRQDMIEQAGISRSRWSRPR